MQGALRALDRLSCSVTTENGLEVLALLAKFAAHEDASWVAGAFATFAMGCKTRCSECRCTVFLSQSSPMSYSIRVNKSPPQMPRLAHLPTPQAIG